MDPKTTKTFRMNASSKEQLRKKLDRARADVALSHWGQEARSALSGIAFLILSHAEALALSEGKLTVLIAELDTLMGHLDTVWKQLKEDRPQRSADEPAASE